MVMLRKQGGTKEIMWDAGYRIGLGAREPGKAQHTARGWEGVPVSARTTQAWPRELPLSAPKLLLRMVLAPRGDPGYSPAPSLRLGASARAAATQTLVKLWLAN